jgi:hypothetical protein
LQWLRFGAQRWGEPAYRDFHNALLAGGRVSRGQWVVRLGRLWACTVCGGRIGSGCRWTLRDVTSEECRGGSVYLSVIMVARQDCTDFCQQPADSCLDRSLSLSRTRACALSLFSLSLSLARARARGAPRNAPQEDHKDGEKENDQEVDFAQRSGERRDCQNLGGTADEVFQGLDSFE